MNQGSSHRLSHLKIDKENLNAEGFTLTGVYDTARVKIMKEVASDLGIEITILAEAGETYTTMSGVTRTVRPGHTYIKIYWPERSGIDTFWAEVKRLSTP